MADSHFLRERGSEIPDRHIHLRGKEKERERKSNLYLPKPKALARKALRKERTVHFRLIRVS
jgi:hypothetical protein